MAVYAQFDKDGACIQIASNVGWSEFGDWCETLTGFQRLRKLFDEGNTEDIEGVRAELEELLEKQPPPNPDVESVAHQIIHAIDAAGPAEILLVTAGITTK
jgi:hypothetical protein